MNTPTFITSNAHAKAFTLNFKLMKLKINPSRPNSKDINHNNVSSNIKWSNIIATGMIAQNNLSMKFPLTVVVLKFYT